MQYISKFSVEENKITIIIKIKIKLNAYNIPAVLKLDYAYFRVPLRVYADGTHNKYSLHRKMMRVGRYFSKYA